MGGPWSLDSSDLCFSWGFTGVGSEKSSLPLPIMTLTSLDFALFLGHLRWILSGKAAVIDQFVLWVPSQIRHSLFEVDITVPQ